MSFYFTADTHYCHKRAIAYCNRPFRDVLEMNEVMVERWNSRVLPNDLVYHLGDFCLGKPDEAIRLAKRLHGRKHLIWGNHDKKLRRNAEFIAQWEWVKDLTEIRIGDQAIVLCHFPLLTWNKSHHGSWHLHGHSHGTLPEDPHSRRVDVGVDSWGFSPVSLESIQTKMNTKIFRPVDHHGRQ